MIQNIDCHKVQSIVACSMDLKPSEIYLGMYKDQRDEYIQFRTLLKLVADGVSTNKKTME